MMTAGHRSWVATYLNDANKARQASDRLELHRVHFSLLPLLLADFGASTPLVDLAFWTGDRGTLKKVERRATKIGKVPILFAPAQAAGRHAGVAARRKQFDKAERLFADAIVGFDRASMKMHAAACRMRRGEILGGDEGRALLAAGEATMREEGVVKPEQFAQCYAPRFPLR